MILLYVSSTTVAYGKKNENIKRYLDLNDLNYSISHLEWFVYRINQQQIIYLNESRGIILPLKHC